MLKALAVIFCRVLLPGGSQSCASALVWALCLSTKSAAVDSQPVTAISPTIAMTIMMSACPFP